MALRKSEFQANGVWKTFVGGNLTYRLATQLTFLTRLLGFILSPSAKKDVHGEAGDADPVAWLLGDAPADKIGEASKGPGGSGRPRWLCPCSRPTAGPRLSDERQNASAR